MMNMFDLTGKTALVTGSGRGIGNTLAHGLAQAGARIVINDISAEAVDAAVKKLQDAGVSAMGVVFDVTKKDQICAGFDTVEKEWGPVDILVNNAGIHRRAPLEEMSDTDWRMVIDTNLTSAFLVGQRAAQTMIKRRQGKIINICSVNSQLPRPMIGNYSTAKGGLVLLTRAMTVEWAKYNIQSNGLAPGYIETDLCRPLLEDPEKNAWIKSITPANRWGKTEDLIGTAVFLASAASQFVTGQVIFVDGGMTVSL